MSEDKQPAGEMKAKRTSVRRRIAFAALTLVLFLGVCELGLRLTGWVLLRRASGKMSRQTDDGVFRIVCLGDSFTWGVGADAATESYPRVLEGLLGSGGSSRFRVENVGVPGLSASGVLRRLEDYSKEDADLFIIMAGMNVNERDLIELRRYGAARANYPLLRVKGALAHLRTYKLLRNGVNYVRLRFFPRALTGGRDDAMVLYNFQDYQRICERDLIRVCELVRERGMKSVLLNYPQKVPPENPYSKIEYYHLHWRGNLPHAYWSGKKRPPPEAIRELDYLVKTEAGETALNAIIRKVAAFYRVPLIDVRSAFERQGNGDELYSTDAHPNAAGYRLMAEAVRRGLLERGLMSHAGLGSSRMNVR